ncbi:MAG: hypothetical protein J7559_04575 [Cohnella sp.]|nr:hypothetical protein [Cohnella sp.]
MSKGIRRILACIVIVSILACSVSDTGYALTRRHFVTLEEMIAESDSIVEARKTKAVVFEERYIPGELSEVEVIRVIKGDSEMLHKKIKVLDLNGPNENIEHYMLMLQPEIANYGEDVYGTIGIAEGILVVEENGKVRYGGWSEPENGDEHLLAKAFDGVSLARAIAIMRSPDLRTSDNRTFPAQAAALTVFVLTAMILAVRHRTSSAKTPKPK